MDCATSTAPNHPDLEVTKILGAPSRVRKYHMIPGCSPDLNYLAYNTDIQALEMALKERVFFVKNEEGKFVPPPAPLPQVFTRLNFILKHFSRQDTFSNRMTYQTYVDTCPAQKRPIYRNAMERLLQSGIHKKHSHVGAFVKFEKLLFTSLKTPVPRLISTRKPDFHLELGTYIRPIEKRIYAAIDKLLLSPTIMKGYNMEDRGAIIESHFKYFKNTVAIGLDAKRFDQHVSVDALMFEHEVYQKYYPKCRLLRKLLKWQLKNIGAAALPSGKVKYTTQGKRQSGDVNTSLGNCILMSSMVIGLAKSLEIVIRLVNDGDDCVVFMETKDEERFGNAVRQWFLDFGFQVEVEPSVYELEKVSFCQAQPVFDGKQYVMVRDPRVSIAKDCISLKPLDNDKITQRFCAAIGKGGISMTGGIPVVQSFYEMLVRSSNGAKPLDDLSLYKYTGRGLGMDRQLRAPTAESRCSFYLAFGIPPDAQIAIEEYYGGYCVGKVGDDGPRHFLMPYL